MGVMSSNLGDLKETVTRVVARDVAPLSQQVDRDCMWPAHSMAAFAEAGLMGLHVPANFGGHGQGLVALSQLTEIIGKACPSSALCFGMHCVGSAVIAAKATERQQNEYLRPIAAGKHITTLALSETGSGAHLYLPQTQLVRQQDNFQINGTKQFVTNGGHADSYVISTVAAADQQEAGELSCLIVESATPGLQWLDEWRGMGMRGNSSRGLHFDDVSVPAANLLGEVGDQVWYIFEVVVPYFLMAMAGTYLGVAQGAVDAARQHLQSRRYNHSGESLAESEILQARMAEMWASVEKTRCLIHEAAHRGDMGHPDALPFLLACKAEAGDTAVAVTNEAMTMCGGHAYSENSKLAQMLRDARAAHVMAPTTDLLKVWTGRALLGLPLL